MVFIIYQSRLSLKFVYNKTASFKLTAIYNYIAILNLFGWDCEMGHLIRNQRRTKKQRR